MYVNGFMPWHLLLMIAPQILPYILTIWITCILLVVLWCASRLLYIRPLLSVSLHLLPAVCKTNSEADPVVCRPTGVSMHSSTPRPASSKLTSPIIVALDVCYPHFNLCEYSLLIQLCCAHFSVDPAVYPHNSETIYPSAELAVPTRAVDVSLSVAYPCLDICKSCALTRKVRYSTRAQIRLSTRTTYATSIPQSIILQLLKMLIRAHQSL